MAESDDINAEHAAVAAQIDADVGVEHVADVYAEALLGATEHAGQTDAVLAEFDELIQGVFARFPRLEAVLTSALVSDDEKVGIIDRLLAGRASPLVVNFLKVVADHGRLDLLRVIHRQAGLRRDKLRGRIHVELVTATEIDDALAQRIAARLRKALDGEPVIRRVTDPGLIAGAIVRIGDTVYDGSVANQLSNIRQQMIDRSVHEIQSRRDRFRHPAGN
ncbi:MAG: ATP synthase F1 subunit delta [Candidatus Nealsonbacteria bacterium]|nr:ATP synthase F1 subunit delta [Candidatus Nealsonbacteria bacterium]